MFDISVPKIDMELMIVNVQWRPEYENTTSPEYIELTDNITRAVSMVL
jgi:gamma-glutamyl-gamma-aminobutyrate hydrolase PuuD